MVKVQRLNGEILNYFNKKEVLFINREKYIIDYLYNKKRMTSKEIGKLLNLTSHQIHHRLQKYKLSNPLNFECAFTEYQEQIILSGILGDGNLKHNGKNYYYRESHSVKEREYLLYKYNIMKEITTKRIQFIKKRKITQNNQLLYQTKNIVSLNKFSRMSKTDVIKKLNWFGICLLFLDDGWYSSSSKRGYLKLSTGLLNTFEIKLLTSKINSELNIESYNINQEIVIKSKYNKWVTFLFLEIFGDIDIIKKKILKLK